MNIIRQFVRRFGTRLPGIYDTKNPIDILKSEMTGVNYREGTATPVEPACPRECDVVVIGGGLMGSAVAYWLSERSPRGFTISIVERDHYYTQSSSVLSAGGVRHQFSLKQNVQMSMFTTEFLRDVKLHLSVLDMEVPDVPFSHNGYLFLATDKYVDTLRNQVTLQNELGAVIDFLSKDQLTAKFPWINFDGVEAGSYGVYGEGWFDPWSLMTALKRKNLSNGVRYIQGEVVAVNHKMDDDGMPFHIDSVDVKIPNGDIQPLQFCFCVNAAGAFAGDVAKMAGIGTGVGVNAVQLPVEPRKRYVYVVHCENGPGLKSPFMIDTTGVYYRREGVGGNYICGLSPDTIEAEPPTDNLDVDYDYFYDKVWPLLSHRVPCFDALLTPSHGHNDEPPTDNLDVDYDYFYDKVWPLLSHRVPCFDADEPPTDNLDVDYDYFYDKVWPLLSHRVPCFESLKVKSAWAGYYDYNYFDNNPVIGNHPTFRNMYFLTGFSGHGVQHAMAAARGVMELAIDDGFKTIDLEPFCFERILENQPIYEEGII